jgi:hypothetical protein
MPLTTLDPQAATDLEDQLKARGVTRIIDLLVKRGA